MRSSEEANDLREKAYRINETIIIFIGIAMFWMPPITGIFGGSVTKEFILGATFASFFLALSDGILISETATKSNVLWYGISFVSGILSIIYLPVLLSMYPSLLERLDPMSTDITLMALGFVLIVVGFRSFAYKSKTISEVRTELDALISRSEGVFENLDDIKSSNDALAKSLAEKDLYIEEIRRKLIELENENERIKFENRKG